VLFDQCAARGWRRIVLYGAGDLAEIAVLSAGESAIEVCCVVDGAQAGRRCAGVPIVADFARARLAAEPDGFDGVVVTDTQVPQASFDALIATAKENGLAPASIVAPSLLSISRLAAAEASAP
jgi:hypothetical protein